MAEIAVRILGLLKDPIDSSFRFVKRQISYSFNYNSKVEKLQSETLALKNQRDILQHSVDEAQRNGEEIYENVRNWLTSAPSAIETAEGIISEKEDIMKKKCCMIGCIPDLKDRRRLSRKAEKQGFEINKLASERGTFTSISCCRTPKQITPSSVYDGEGLESRGSLLKDVINALRNPNHRVIGVYGVGGVGKTTLAKEVQRNVQLENSFDVVIFVAVSEAPDISKIQRVIADVLGLTLTEEDVEVRAEHLCKRLKDEKSKLIILDDVWIQLKWDEVGIPSGSGVNCKILLTSRRITVCQEMGARKNFSIDVLSEEEAWSLFKKTVIGDATYRELPPIANDIAKKCSGLPLLIEKVGKDLKNKPLPYWDDMLERLSYFGDEEIEKKVYSVLKRSYDNLNTEEAKSFFLLCSLFGQANVETEDLVRCSMGLGLLKGVHTITGATNRVDRLIGDLKADSLFLEGDVDSRYVKIHDVVLDTARLIAYHEKHAILEIGDFEEKENSKCTQVSLPHCSTEERLPEKLDCPKAELLILLRKGPRHSLILNSGFCIPQGFFEGNTELKVVSLSGMNLNPLSPSFSGLTNVRTLFLHYCKLGDIAMIGQLIKLEVLSFKNSYIVRVPSEIEQLTRLKLLDLRGCYIIRFPANVLQNCQCWKNCIWGDFLNGI